MKINFKKFFVAYIFAICFFTSKSQELFDALSFAELPIQGTARSMSMSGAFGALGGEPTCMITNPAGLGIYRSCEATLTLNNNFSQHNTSSTRNSNNHFTLGQASYVHAILLNKKVLIASNFAISFNRLKNFQNKYSLTNEVSSSIINYMANQANGVSENAFLETNDPYNNSQIGWLSALGYDNYLIKSSGLKQWEPMNNAKVASNFQYVETGGVDEFNISYGANLAHLFYLGASVGVQTIEKSVTSIYSENFHSLDKEELQMKNKVVFSGVGCNLKLGAIARPTSFLRLGFAYHTPTVYVISQHSITGMESRNVLDGKGNRVDVVSSTGDGVDNYQLKTPSRFLFSTAFIIKKKALVDIDYELVDYRTMLYADEFSTENFSNENRIIKNFAKINHTLKVGGEYRVLDFLSLRLGGAFATPVIERNTMKTLPENSIRTDLESMVKAWSYNVSGGIGFRWTYWGIDLAYQYNQQYATLAPIVGVKPVNLTNSYHNVLLTGSFRF